MTIHLKWAKELKLQGERLGREGLSERVFQLVEEFQKDPTPKGAMHLSGQLKAIAQAANFDCYWKEKVSNGYHAERLDLAQFEPRGVSDTPASPTKPEGSQNNGSLALSHKPMGI